MPPEIHSCRAPFVSLRLEPTGTVQACCVNDAYPLGSIAEQSLLDIWRGPKAQRLRQAMVEDDYSYGCQGCGDPIALGLRTQTLAPDYDHFPVPDDLGWPKHIEFAVSNTCNLQCVQCDGELSSSIRAQREHRPPLRSPYGDEFFASLEEFLPHLEAATFIGGEPFLMREARRIWDRLLELDDPPEVWVTTNGTVWDDRVERYLHGLRMGVSLSIDGVRPETIAAIRVGADPEALLANRDRFLAATRSYGRGMKFNYCVMPQNWAEFMPFLLDAEALGVSVFAARVQEPHEHSLYHLRADELRRVVDGLNEQGAAHADELVINRTAWDGTLAELSLTLDRTTPEPVFVAPPRRLEADTRVQVARFRSELASAGGVPPVHLAIQGGLVADVECPDWAASLGFDDLVGVAADALLPTVERRLGIDLEPRSVPGEAEVHGVTCELEHEGSSTTIHSVSIAGEAGAVDVLVGLVPT